MTNSGDDVQRDQGLLADGPGRVAEAGEAGDARAASDLQATDLIPGDLVSIDGRGGVLIVGVPHAHTDPSGRPFVVVDVVRGPGGPSPIAIEEGTSLQRILFDAQRYELDIDPPGGSIREIRAMGRRRGRGRVIGAVSWRDHDGVVVNIEPASPHDPLHKLLVVAAHDACPGLQVPDRHKHWTPDLATLVPGELITIGEIGQVLVAASPQRYTDPEGRPFFRIETAYHDRSSMRLLDSETVWRRDRFHPARYQLFPVPAPEGQQCLQVKTRAGVTAGEVTWSATDGAVVSIRPGHPLHPLHRWLTLQITDPRRRIDDTTDPATLAVDDIVVSDDGEYLIAGPPSRPSGTHEDPQIPRPYAYPVIRRADGSQGTMAFEVGIPVPRTRFDASGIRFEVAAPNGHDHTVTAYSDRGRRLGAVCWWEGYDEVSTISPPHPDDPLHTLLLARAREICPALFVHSPQHPHTHDPEGKIVSRQVFISARDTGPDVLVGDFLTEETAAGPWNLPDTEHHALQSAWRRHQDLYVVISRNQDTDVATPLAWAVSGEELYMANTHHDGVVGEHQQFVWTTR